MILKSSIIVLLIFCAVNLENIMGNYIKAIKDNYSKDIGLPENYKYDNGTVILPLPPVEMATNGVFVIGAYPSAVFKRVGKNTIPIDNLKKPFDDTVYIDSDGEGIKE